MKSRQCILSVADRIMEREKWGVFWERKSGGEGRGNAFIFISEYQDSFVDLPFGVLSNGIMEWEKWGAFWEGRRGEESGG